MNDRDRDRVRAGVRGDLFPCGLVPWKLFPWIHVKLLSSPRICSPPGEFVPSLLVLAMPRQPLLCSLCEAHGDSWRMALAHWHYTVLTFYIQSW